MTDYADLEIGLHHRDGRTHEGHRLPKPCGQVSRLEGNHVTIVRE